MPYCPKRGDVVWLVFDPQAGHEQAGRRPALTISPESYNRKTGLALFCPISSREKGYPFEVKIPSGIKVSGVVLADQIKSLDWSARKSEFAARISSAIISEVIERVQTILE